MIYRLNWGRCFIIISVAMYFNPSELGYVFGQAPPLAMVISVVVGRFARLESSFMRAHRYDCQYQFIAGFDQFHCGFVSGGAFRINPIHVQYSIT